MYLAGLLFGGVLAFLAKLRCQNPEYEHSDCFFCGGSCVVSAMKEKERRERETDLRKIRKKKKL